MPVRPALDHDVVDEPAFQTTAPGPDIDLDTVLLDVGPGRQEQPARRHRAGRPALAPVVEPLPVRGFSGLDPGLAEDGVPKRLDRLVRPLRRVPSPHDPLPAQPADRRVERREVIPDRGRIGGRGGRPPFAAFQHRRLVVFRDCRVAPLAVIFRRLRAALLPAQPVELQPLHRAAVLARHEEPALITGLVLALDPAQPPYGWGRDQKHLAPMGEGQRPRLGQRDRIAFLVGRGGIGVDLVKEDVARGRGAQPDRRVCAGHDQDAARELLGQHGVARVAGSGRLDPLPQVRALVDQRIDPLARVALGQFHRRLDREHRARRLVDREPDPVVARLGRADLRGLHEHDPLRRIARRQPVHDFAHVGRAHRPVPPGLSRGAAREHPVPVRPFRDGQVRVRPQPVTPGAQDLARAVEVGQCVIFTGSRAGPRRVRRGGRVHVSPAPSASRLAPR